MSNFDTIKAVTDNLEAVLRALGIRFERRTFDDLKDIPASLIPLGQIFYEGEKFEDLHNERPEYAEASFRVRVILNERDPIDMMREQQRWTHSVRDALTVPALNTGALASTKLVSRVEHREAVMANERSDGWAAMNYSLTVRYREA